MSILRTEVGRQSRSAADKFGMIFIRHLFIAIFFFFASLGAPFCVRAYTPPTATYQQALAVCQSQIAAPAFAGYPKRCVDHPIDNTTGYIEADVNNSVYTNNNNYSNYVRYAPNIGNGHGHDSGEGTLQKCSCAADGAPMVSDPINASTGNKYLQEDDYHATAWLTFRRFYNSTPVVTSSTIGVQWRHSFDRSLQLIGTPVTSIVVFRPDGKQETFGKSSGAWVAGHPENDTLTETDNSQGVPTGYVLHVGATRHIENYGAKGQLQTVTDEYGQGITLTYSTAATPTSVAPVPGLLLVVTDPNGRRLSFSYDSSAQLHQVTLPDSGALTYSYDANGNLLSVQYPDARTRQYIYNESSLTGGANLPNAMTGTVDEVGARYESTTYNVAGLATSTSLAGGVSNTTVTYAASNTSVVQYPLGISSTMGFATIDGVIKVASLDQPCGLQCGQAWQVRAYDTNGYPATATDFEGNVTKTIYDANGLLDQQIDASGTTSQRTTNFTWNTTLRVPLTHVVLNANGNTMSSTQWVYNSAGQTLARCEIDPSNSAASGYSCSSSGTVPAGVRRWTYTYCTLVDTTQCPLVGLLLTASGPRTDTTQTTTYSYYLSSSAVSCGTAGAACYQAGDLHTVTDPSGHVTTIVSHDADGRVTRLSDANGINTDLTYTPRGWLATRTVGGAQTSIAYTPYGAVSSVTDPDGVTTTYGYDAAHRLVKITDAQGNYVQYTLDAAGDKTAEQVYDTTGTLHKSLSRTFNTLGQLTTVVDGLNHTVFNAITSGSYDANGNLVQNADGLGIQRQLGYDALNRLVQTLDNYNGTN